MSDIKEKEAACNDRILEITFAVYNVYHEMGCDCPEADYQKRLEEEFDNLEILYDSQPEFTQDHKRQPLGESIRPDLICYNEIIVELKADESITPDHRDQLKRYLKVTGLKVGLLVNFGAYPEADIERQNS